MADDAGPLLDRYRNYLRLLAQLHLHTLVRRKLDPSDVVQQTLVRAVQGLGQLRSREPAAVAAWLRKILARTMADAARDYLRARRDVSLERSLEDALDRSSAALAGCATAAGPSPSEHAAAAERHLRLADALVGLPDAMREAVVLKHCQGWALQQIADHLGRSPAAVASLLRRGLGRLRGLLHEGDE
jgi:RNA polymerase sigma-70 factor, ECF subfamily